jgi:hypothetical protein
MKVLMVDLTAPNYLSTYLPTYLANTVVMAFYEQLAVNNQPKICLGLENSNIHSKPALFLIQIYSL